MNIFKIQPWIALPAVLLLSISVLNLQQTPPTSGVQDSLNSGLSDALVQNPDLPAGTASSSFMVAGNAPCNPEQQVCDK